MWIYSLFDDIIIPPGDVPKGCHLERESCKGNLENSLYMSIARA